MIISIPNDLMILYGVMIDTVKLPFGLFPVSPKRGYLVVCAVLQTFLCLLIGTVDMNVHWFIAVNFLVAVFQMYNNAIIEGLTCI